MDKRLIKALLAREERDIDLAAAVKIVSGKTVLVTGGGGFIGSGICRKTASLSPARIVIVDLNENGAYELAHELNHGTGAGCATVEVASVRDTRRINALFEKYRPEIVFHAAAHKHVPLMERAPLEAVKNNLFGTENVINAAISNGCERFMLISTDKAIDPVSVMGASKRFAELMTLTSKGAIFSAVRFGNVLGSSGSVLPIFENQIAKGRPVTLTDGSDERFFMTVSEAASLVLIALAEPSGLYVMDPGSPVNMRDFAERLIGYHGLTPYKDIEITETGRRPGDRQSEVMFPEGDLFAPTSEPSIFRDLSPLPPRAEIDRRLAALHALAADPESETDPIRVRAALFDAVRF